MATISPVGLGALLQNDGIPGPEVLLRLLPKAEAAVRPDVLQGGAAALQALDALHPVEGFLRVDPAAAALPPARRTAGAKPWARAAAAAAAKPGSRASRWPTATVGSGT